MKNNNKGRIAVTELFSKGTKISVAIEYTETERAHHYEVVEYANDEKATRTVLVTTIYVATAYEVLGIAVVGLVSTGYCFE